MKRIQYEIPIDLTARGITYATYEGTEASYNACLNKISAAQEEGKITGLVAIALRGQLGTVRAQMTGEPNEHEAISPATDENMLRRIINDNDGIDNLLRALGYKV